MCGFFNIYQWHVCSIFFGDKYVSRIFLYLLVEKYLFRAVFMYQWQIFCRFYFIFIKWQIWVLYLWCIKTYIFVLCFLYLSVINIFPVFFISFFCNDMWKIIVSVSDWAILWHRWTDVQNHHIIEFLIGHANSQILLFGEWWK